jgi:antitoxin MazE
LKISTGKHILQAALAGGGNMQIAKWGDSLVLRLPEVVVEALDLKEGDDVTVSIAGARELSVERSMSREEALERLRTFRKVLPIDWKFDREEANAR